MSLLLIAPDLKMIAWENALKSSDPDIDIEIWPDVSDRKRVQFAVCWNHPDHVLDQYPNLKGVSSLGPGADHLLSDDSLPESVDICRVVSASLVQQMKEYILGVVLNIQRNFVRYIRQKDHQKWQAHNHPLAENVNIGIMGLGKLGKPIAQQLGEIGYNVSGWSRSTKKLPEVQCFAGDNQLTAFLSTTRILVCLLPLNFETEGILDLNLFKKLKPNGWIINVARGGHLVDEDLIYALDSNILRGAWLDVFFEEPLPNRHPFWNRSNIILTPHIASITQPSEVASQIIENYKRALSGMELKHAVDKKKGY